MTSRCLRMLYLQMWRLEKSFTMITRTKVKHQGELQLESCFVFNSLIFSCLFCLVSFLYSICSDVSFANYCDRKVEDISKILENLSSTHWTDRKAAEVAAHFAMSNYDPVRCFQLIKPYINSNESSISIASIKMLTKVSVLKRATESPSNCPFSAGRV